MWMTRRSYQLDGEPQAGQTPNEPVRQRDLAGYPDEAALVRGYRESSAEAQRLRAQNQLLEQQLLQQEQQRTINQRPSPMQQLQEYGIPIDPLDQLIQQRVAAAFEPVVRSVQARSTVVAQYEDYNKFEADVARYIQADPQLSQSYQTMFQADPAGAMEWAYLKYGNHQRTNQPPPPDNGQGMKEASIPTSRGGGDGTRNTNPIQERVERAWEHYQKTGQPQAYAMARLQQAIPDSYFEQK